MAIATFGICLMISCGIILYMSSKEYENIDRYYWTIVILIPIIILGYWLKTLVVSEEAAAITFCFIYLDSTILLTIMIFLMLRTIGIRVHPVVRAFAYSIALLHLFVVWGCIHNNLYFKKIHLQITEGGTITKMESGPLRIYHYVYITVIITIIVAILITGFLKQGSFSRRSLRIYAFVTLLGISIYVMEWLTDINFSLLPYLYVFSDILIAIQYDRIHMYDITFITAEGAWQQGLCGLRQKRTLFEPKQVHPVLLAAAGRAKDR